MVGEPELPIARVCGSCGRINVVDAKSCASCSGALREGPPDCVIDGRYIVTRELGRGGMGVVYLARDPSLDRDLALKVIAPHNNAPGEGARLRREAAALASVRSENVVAVYAFGPLGESFFYAMEYVAGESLGDLIHQHSHHKTFVPLSRAIAILRSIAAGLDTVHAAGLLHRDIKPDNIVVERRTGRPVLLDFGLAKRVDGTRVEHLAGTPSYMSPEQIAPGGTWGEPSPRSDIYGFACTAFELLTGKVPFFGDNAEQLWSSHCFKAPPLASSLRPSLIEMDPVLARGLQKDPDKRYPTALNLATDLAAALEKTLSPSPTLVLTEAVRSEMILRTGGEKPLEVLVVDDEPTFRRIATRCVQLGLPQRSLRIRNVESGAAAIAAANEATPDLLLLDYFMPGMDGIETLIKLRSLPDGFRTRVVVVSASVGKVERWRFGVLGVEDFVEKPLNMQRFISGLGEIAAHAGWVPSVSSQHLGA